MKTSPHTYKRANESAAQPRSATCKLTTSRALYLAAIAALLSLGTHSAEAVNWAGPVGGNWNDPANWGGTLPGNTDLAGIYESGAVVTDTQTVGRVNVGDGTSNFDSYLTISGSLSLNTGSGYVFRQNWGGSGGGTGSSTVNVDGGTLSASRGIQSGTADGLAATLNVTAGGTVTIDNGNLNYTSSNGAGRAILVDGAGSSLTVSGQTLLNGTTPGTLTISNGGIFTTGSGTITGVVGGAGGTFVQDGVGATTTLSGVNTFTGDYTVSNGTLAIGGSGKVGNYTGAITIASGATFEYASDQSGGNGNRFLGGISGDGTFVVNTTSGSVLSRAQVVSVANIEIKSGILNGQANASSLGTAATTIYLGDTSGSADAELRYSGSGGTFTTKAGIIVQAGSTGTKTISSVLPSVIDNTNITLNGDLTLAPGQHANNDRSLTLGGVISGTGSLIMDGVANGSGDPGVAILTGANSYSGGTTINAGRLVLSMGDNPDTYPQGTITINNGGTLAYGNYHQTGRIAGSIADVVVNAGGVIDSSGTVNAFENLTLNGGTMQGNGGLNAAWGAFVMLDTVTVTADSLIQNASGTNNYLSPGLFNGSRTLTFDVAGGATLTNELGMVDYNGNRTYTIVKDGTGTAVFSGESSYTGTTSVSAGTLALSHASLQNNIANSTVIDVASGATLNVSALGGGSGGLVLASGQTISGTGSVVGGTTVGAGATLSPGNSPGTQTFDNLTWVNGGTYLWEINADTPSGGSAGNDPGWDWINVTNTFDLSGITTGFNIDITSLTTGNVAGLASGFDYSGKAYLDLYQSFTILSFGSLTGTFDASEFNLQTGNFANPNVAWSLELIGNDLVLNAVFVPEPSSTALLGLGGLILAFRRKR